MNKEQFASQWKILKPKLQAKWAKLTEEEFAQVNGRREHLLTLIQKKYGLDRAAVEAELVQIEATLSHGAACHPAGAPNARPQNPGAQKNPHASNYSQPAPGASQHPKKEKGNREKVKQGDRSPF